MKGHPMQYALLIYEDESLYGRTKSGPAMDAIAAKHMAFSADLGDARKGGAGLKHTSSATTLQARDGVRTVHDGPFAETKEQLAGFYLIEAPDLDAAIAIAKKLPLAGDGAIEIRPTLVRPLPTP
jgi:hypothetical protein